MSMGIQNITYFVQVMSVTCSYKACFFLALAKLIKINVHNFTFHLSPSFIQEVLKDFLM